MLVDFGYPIHSDGEQTEMSNALLISRLNANTIGCNKGAAGALEPGSKVEIYLYRVIGVIMGLERGETDMGEYYGLVGRFQAENKQEGTEGFGKLYESDTLFLPPGGHDSIVNSILPQVVFGKPTTRSKTVTGMLADGKQVNFAADVYVRRDNNASGIGYVTRPILETVNDPLEEIRKAVVDAEQRLIAANAAETSAKDAQLAAGPGPKMLPAGAGKSK